MSQAMTALLIALGIIYALCGWLIWRDWRRAHARRVAPVPLTDSERRFLVERKRMVASVCGDNRPAEDLGPLQFSRQVEPMKRRRRK